MNKYIGKAVDANEEGRPAGLFENILKLKKPFKTDDFLFLNKGSFLNAGISRIAMDAGSGAAELSERQGTGGIQWKMFPQMGGMSRLKALCFTARRSA